MQTKGKPKRWPAAVAALGFQTGVISYRKGTATGSADHVHTQNSAFYQGKVLPNSILFSMLRKENTYIYAFVLAESVNPLRITFTLSFQLSAF